MALFKKKFVCPHCFEKQDLYKIKFRCQNNPAKCAPVEDTVYAAFKETTSALMNKTFDIPRPKNNWDNMTSWQLPRSMNCPHCNEKSTLRICANCHSELPYTIGDYKDLTFAMIGAKESGKSHYISVLINTIENQIGKTFNANLQKIDDNTIRKYREQFYNPIFRQKQVIPETRSGRADYNVKEPMLFSLSFMKKRLWGKSYISNVSTIAFFDTAGEDLNAEETMKTENKYIYNSTGIILLIDPLQITEVRDQLIFKGINLPHINSETEDIISRVAKLIRTATHTPVNELIDIPIAVTFSKIDALKDIIDNSSSLFTPSNHQGYFNISEAENINTEVENLMIEWAGQHLINEVKHNFKTYSFFGVSALGSNPHGTNRIVNLRPIRVEDPFLWLLFKNKIIKNK